MLNTTRLEKHYGSLSPLERMALIHDADRRRDFMQAMAVKQASPCSYAVDDVGKLEFEIRHLATLHRAELLEIAAEFWVAQTNVAWAGERLDAMTDDERMADDAAGKELLWWCNVVKTTETKYCIERDGWLLFVKQCGLDRSRIERTPRWWLLDYMDERAQVQDDCEQALRCLTGQVEPYTLKTAESVANDWHQTVAEIVALTKKM